MRIPGVNIFFTISRWIWPIDRCANCCSIYSVAPSMDRSIRNLDHIYRSADGRFVLADDRDITDGQPISSAESDISGSDDGGFLPKRGVSGRASWRRPLVSVPSQLSFRSDEESESSHLYKNISGLFRRRTNRSQPHRLLKTVPAQYFIPPIDQSLHINTISANVPGPMVQTPYTPSRVSRIVSSSPATSSPMGATIMYSPHVMYFSDLSSVREPSSAERSFPSRTSGISQLRYLQERYSQELPSLRAIHEETRQMAQNMLPLHVQMHSPSWRYPQSMSHHQHLSPYRLRSKLLPRYGRMACSAPELGSPSGHFNVATHLLQQSPESRSSSSGFGSKNTSTQQNQSSQSGGSAQNWRFLPPYKPPPPPPPTVSDYHYYTYQPIRPDSQIERQFHSFVRQPADSLPYSMGHWLELMTHLNAASDQVNVPKSVDVGSVDGHYEFDPATPTPTASTPTGPHDDTFVEQHYPSSTHHYGMYQRKRLLSKYDNIEARVQAMKEEFYAYRKRHGIRQADVELESTC